MEYVTPVTNPWNQISLGYVSGFIWLTYEAPINPQTSCEVALEPFEWQALYCHVSQSTTPPTHPPSLQQAVFWIARLGGFLARKCDGQPGVKNLWRGLRRLHDIATGDSFTLILSL